MWLERAPLVLPVRQVVGSIPPVPTTGGWELGGIVLTKRAEGLVVSRDQANPVLISDDCPPLLLPSRVRTGENATRGVLSGVGIATAQGVRPNQSDKAGSDKQKETPPQPFLVGEGLPTSSPSEMGCKNLEGHVLWTWWSCSGIIFRHLTHGQEGSSGGQDAKQGQLEGGTQSA